MSRSTAFSEHARFSRKLREVRSVPLEDISNALCPRRQECASGSLFTVRFGAKGTEYQDSYSSPFGTYLPLTKYEMDTINNNIEARLVGCIVHMGS